MTSPHLENSSGTTTSEPTAPSISTQAPSKFTPGPWERDEIDRWRVNCSSRGEMICATGLNGYHVEEAAANALLIAAAPDMLAALRAVTKCDSYADPDGWVRRVVDAAISKATGGAS